MEDQNKKQSKAFWARQKNAKRVKSWEEDVKIRLTKEECKKCRYECVEQSTRMYECTVHKGDFSHGLRMHPPHLYDLRDGIVYYKGERWFPDFAANRERLKQD